MALKKRGGGTPLISERCKWCSSKAQTERHVHFLKLGHGLAGHLKREYVDHLPQHSDAETAAQSNVSGIIRWAEGIQSDYADMVDEQGVRLPAWKAWLLSGGQNPARYEDV